MLSILGNGYFLKITKTYSQQEKQICPNCTISFHKTLKIANPQKFHATQYNPTIATLTPNLHRKKLNNIAFSKTGQREKHKTNE